MSQSDRIHGFDTLRAMALLLGILLHAIMPYIQPSLDIWFVLDEDKQIGYTILLVVIHAFRLQTFFLLAGFFSSLLIEKRGLKSFVINRVQRVLVPLLLSVLIIVPLCQLLMVVGYSLRDGAGYVQIGEYVIDTRAYNSSVIDFFQSGLFVREIFLYHIWFLYYLVMIYAGYLLVRYLGVQLGIANVCEALTRWLLGSPWGIPILTMSSTLAMWPMRLWQVDTPYSIIPNGLILAYYFLFFGMGVALQTDANLLEMLKRRSRVYLVVALLVLPVLLFGQVYGPNPFGRPVIWSYKPWALFAYNLFTWLVVLGLVGGFAQWFGKPSHTIRRVSETAYWQYLIHLPLLVAMQIGFASLPWPSYLEIMVQVLVAYLVLYWSYIGIVGRTMIGRLLNGRTIQEINLGAEQLQN